MSQGIINYQREISLRMFLFDADMIIHESGVPPIHTAISGTTGPPRTHVFFFTDHFLTAHRTHRTHRAHRTHRFE